MFKNLSIKNKIIFLSALPIIALIFILSLALSELKHTAEGVDRIYLDRVVPLKDLKVISDGYAILVVDAVNKANAGLASAQETAKVIRSSEELIAKMWKKFMATTLTLEEAKLASEAEILFKEADKAILEVEHLLATMSGNIQGQLNEIDGHLYSSVDPINEKITELIELQLSVAKEEHDMIITEYEENSVLLLGLSGVTIILLIFLGITTFRSIIGALNRIRGVIETVVKESDLSIEIEVKKNNELSAIARSFNSMIVQMRELVCQVTETSDQLSISSHDMTDVSGQAKKSINTQREEIEQVAAAMNEMVSTAQEIANNAEAADRGARSTSNQAQEGRETASKAVDATNLLVEDVVNVSEHIKELETDSTNIGSIVDVIKGIAEQTNLLALNAAIEAARAGDQGRGFAVVADEVRSLAQRTQISTQEIQDAIERLQQGTSKAVNAMQKGQNNAEGAGKMAVEAGNALETISFSIQEITDMNALIATASGEQTSVSEEINKSLLTLHDTSNDSSEGAEKISAASKQMSELSDNLKKTISQYKT